MTDITPRDHLSVETSADIVVELDTRGETEEQAMARLVEDHAVRAIERHLTSSAPTTQAYHVQDADTSDRASRD